jgi:hypothetical protein
VVSGGEVEWGDIQHKLWDEKKTKGRVIRQSNMYRQVSGWQLLRRLEELGSLEDAKRRMCVCVGEWEKVRESGRERDRGTMEEPEGNKLRALCFPTHWGLKSLSFGADVLEMFITAVTYQCKRWHAPERQ